MVSVKSSLLARSLENPKSAILISPSWRRMLGSLKSRCIILCLTNVLKALSI